MVNQYRLYTIREWEQAQPEGVSFSRFFLTDHSGEVRKVTGTIRVLKRKLVNGVMCPDSDRQARVLGRIWTLLCRHT